MAFVAAAAEGLKRDVRVMSLIGTAHFSSHFYQLMLPPLFPLLAERFGVGYAALGLLPATFFTVSGICQTIAGFMVDRFGARNVLVAGLAALAAATAATSLVTEFWMLIVVSALAGIGNSVFHPADFAILNASVATNRLGRAFGVHGIGGNLGWAVAPVTVAALTALLGWQTALLILGSLGLVMAAFLWSQSAVFVDHRHPNVAAPGPPSSSRAAARPGAGESRLGADIRLLTTAPVLLCFAFFTIYTMAFIGLQTFSVPALMALADLPLAVATGALTGYGIGGVLGVLAGGLIADRFGRHTLVAVLGMAGGSLCSLMIGLGPSLAAFLVVMMTGAGLFLGLMGPSRDLLVRAAAPPGATGKVYGFVYSGLDLGSALVPLFFGWLIDSDLPRAMYLAAAILLLVTIVPIWQVHRQAVARVAA